MKKQKSPKKNPSGTLYKFIQNKTNKGGRIATYPKVEGKRNPRKERDWYWAYCWDEKDEDGEWRTRKRSVRIEKVEIVRKAIAEKQIIEEILKLL
jgi:hypothetical protein